MACIVMAYIVMVVAGGSEAVVRLGPRAAQHLLPHAQCQHLVQRLEYEQTELGCVCSGHALEDRDDQVVSLAAEMAREVVLRPVECQMAAQRTDDRLAQFERRRILRLRARRTYTKPSEF